jgi:hypothetical protein
MDPTQPFWFKQRQCKAEPAGDRTLRVTGPNLGEAYLQIRSETPGRWRAALRQTADGPEVAATQADLPTEQDAWDAAFELYRTHVIV